MPAANQAALDFLLNRRSRPARTLGLPIPDPETLTPILTAAARVPDHGKLEPFRFVVLTRPALIRLAKAVKTRGADLGYEPESIAKASDHFATAHLVVVVISAPIKSEKVPAIEQVYAAGAVCLSLVNAALAAGWGANWLSGWPAHDRMFVEESMGLTADESVAGLIHLGTETASPPERPRPDLDRITTWVTE